MSDPVEPPVPKRSLGYRILMSVLRIFLVLVLLLVLLVVVADSLTGAFLVEFVVHMVAGWIFYLWHVTSQVTLNGDLIASSVIALSMAVLGLHKLAGWLWRHSRPEAGPWPFRWTAAITTMLLLLFASANAGAGIGHQIGWLKSMRWAEMSHMGKFTLFRQGGIVERSINSWADDNNNQYPPTLEEALVHQVDEPREFLLVSWPSGSTPEPWLYFGPLIGTRPMQSEKLPLLATPRSYRGKRAVIFADRGGMLMDEDKFQSQLVEMRAKAIPKAATKNSK